MYETIQYNAKQKLELKVTFKSNHFKKKKIILLYNIQDTDVIMHRLCTVITYISIGNAHFIGITVLALYTLVYIYIRTAYGTSIMHYPK